MTAFCLLLHAIFPYFKKKKKIKELRPVVAFEKLFNHIFRSFSVDLFNCHVQIIIIVCIYIIVAILCT